MITTIVSNLKTITWISSFKTLKAAQTSEYENEKRVALAGVGNALPTTRPKIGNDYDNGLWKHAISDDFK